MALVPLFIQAAPAASPGDNRASASPSPRPLIQEAPKAEHRAVFYDTILDRLGWTLFQAIEDLGSPNEVFPLRGEQSWHDDVVFYYDSDHFYLFWWDNRVWQIRFDKRYTGLILGLSMGTARKDVLAALGTAFMETDKDVYYQLPDRGFPVRARLVFEKEKLVDVYIYRSDF